jgi:hypothetical protein
MTLQGSGAVGKYRKQLGRDANQSLPVAGKIAPGGQLVVHRVGPIFPAIRSAHLSLLTVAWQNPPAVSTAQAGKDSDARPGRKRQPRTGRRGCADRCGLTRPSGRPSPGPPRAIKSPASRTSQTATSG